MNGPHAWVTHAIGQYLIVVRVTVALAALLAALVLPWAARMARRLSVGAKLPSGSLPRAGRSGA